MYFYFLMVVQMSIYDIELHLKYQPFAEVIFVTIAWTRLMCLTSAAI
jgi:hypothetical protein